MPLHRANAAALAVACVLAALFSTLVPLHAQSGKIRVTGAGGSIVCPNADEVWKNVGGVMQCAPDATAGTHALVGASHTASGLTAGQPLRATGATAFGFGALDLANVNAIENILPAANVSPAIARWQGPYTIGHADLTEADTSEDETLFNCTRCIVERVLIEHTEAFAGGTLSELACSVGTASAPTFYSNAFEVMQAVGEAAILDTLNSGRPTKAAHDVIARCISVGDNVANATAGSVEIWVKVSTLP